MNLKIPAYYWDTCVFSAYLNKEHDAYGQLVDHIGQFLEEAKNGQCTIHTSTVTIAELKRQYLEESEYDSFTDFLNDFRGAVIPISPDPIMMALAAHLRSQEYEKSKGKRILGTPDAIHLATAVQLVEVYEVDLAQFHTFDAGKQKDANGGKAVPILGYETWCEKCKEDPVVKKAIGLKRFKPEHPTPKMAI